MAALSGNEGKTASPNSPMASVVLVAAAALLTVIARKVAANETTSIDHRVRAMVQAHRTHALDVAVKPVTLLSLPVLIVSATVALAWWLHRRGRDDAALAIGLTPVVAATVGEAFTLFFVQPAPPDAIDGDPSAATFPSGHTTGVTAEALATAYILSRENLASPGVLAALLAWPILVGVTRMYRDRHWCSDTVAGWVAGVGIAALGVMLYQARPLHRELQPRHDEPADIRNAGEHGNLVVEQVRTAQ